MRHLRLFKPESIANVQTEIQIVDTHESLETRIVIGLHAFGHHLNRTLLTAHMFLFDRGYAMRMENIHHSPDGPIVAETTALKSKASRRSTVDSAHAS